MKNLKIGDIVDAPCIHEKIDRVKGIVYKIFRDKINVLIPSIASDFLCTVNGAVIIPDEEAEERMLKFAKGYRKEKN